MATERQIAANRLNAARSTGPRSAEGKAQSRGNATRHGLAGGLDLIAVGGSPEFAARRAKWGEEYRPVGDAACWALDRAVAASLRIERCERAADEVAALARERARLAWDEDRAVEAAEVASRLGREPVLASRQLRATRAGAELMAELWFGLVAKLETGADWSASEASRALDLLGVAADLREGRTLVEPEEGDDPLAFRRALALEEIDRLQALVEESLAPLDEAERGLAIAGESTLIATDSRLVLRYERDAWRRYRESIRQVRDSAPSPFGDPPAPIPISRPSPVDRRVREARERSLAEFSPSFEEERRALLDEASPIRSSAIDRLKAMGLEDEDAWIEELERRVEAGPRAFGESSPLNGATPGLEASSRLAGLLATERTRFGGAFEG